LPGAMRAGLWCQAVCFASAALRLRDDGTFRVVQFADLHFGENEDGTWGPKQDLESLALLREVIKLEDPDLVVFTGDQLTGNNIRSNATAYWSEVVSPCEEAGVPWAAVFGNHETMPFEGGRRAHTNVEVASSTSRHALLQFDMSHNLSRSCLGEMGDGHSVSNYYLDVLDASEKVAVTRLYFMDTGGGDYDEKIFPDQVNWFKNVSANTTMPSYAYFHIPLPAYAAAAQHPACVGMAQDGVTPVATDSGLFQALQDAGVVATFVGHDHGNDWCCPGADGGPVLCFGRHSGYGGYGSWARGGRVLSIAPGGAQSYVRMESGEILHNVTLASTAFV